MFRPKIWSGHLRTNFRWLLPGLLGVSRSTISRHTVTYALHLTPFLEIMVNVPRRPAARDKELF